MKMHRFRQTPAKKIAEATPRETDARAGSRSLRLSGALPAVAGLPRLALREPAVSQRQNPNQRRRVRGCWLRSWKKETSAGVSLLAAC